MTRLIVTYGQNECMECKEFTKHNKHLCLSTNELCNEMFAGAILFGKTFEKIPKKL